MIYHVPTKMRKHAFEAVLPGKTQQACLATEAS